MLVGVFEVRNKYAFHIIICIFMLKAARKLRGLFGVGLSMFMSVCHTLHSVKKRYNLGI